MKIKILPFILFYSILSFGQRITLNELQIFCTNKSWETTNKALLAQKWDYYDSSEGDDEHYNLTKWAYGRNTYDDSKATAWLQLYSYDGLPNKVSFRFRNKEYYNAIQNQIKANNYKQTSENIFDSRVTVTYENPTYFLQLAYNRVEDEDDNYYGSNNKTYTVFDVTVFKKGGVYDPDNGYKKEYNEDGNTSAEYTLKNGKINGTLILYYDNGKLKSKANVVNGLSEGNYEDFFYFDNGDVLKEYGLYKNGKQEGKWINEIIEKDTKFIVKEEFFINGLKEGKSIEADGEDKIIFKNYSNDKLNGNCKIFLNVKRRLIGGYPNIDTLNISKVKIEDLNYLNDKLNGEAKRFDITGSLIEEGFYSDSLKTGKWKFYYNKTIDFKDNKEVEYSRKLYKIGNYLNGEKNGESEQFSFLKQIEVACDENENEICYKSEAIYIHLISNYKNGELDGEYILNNNEGKLLSKGNYSKGIQTGKWIEYGYSLFSDITSNVRNYETGSYINDKKEGKWERFDDDGVLFETYTYNSNNIHGKHITFLNGMGIVHRYFWNGKLNKIEIYKGEKLLRSIDIVSDYSNKYKVIDIESNEKGSELITIKFAKESDDVIDPRYFYGNYVQLDSSHKIKEGLYELKNTEDKMVSTGNYDNNTKNGEWTDIYYDQNVKTTFKYNYGKLYEENYYDIKKNEPYSGEFIFMDTENNITEERKIKNGKRHGTTRYKDQNDKTIRKESFKEGELKE